MMWTSCLLLLFSMASSAEALPLYDPKLCFILDGLLGLYGLFITAMFVREKFFRVKSKTDDALYSSLQHRDQGRVENETRARAHGVPDNSLYMGLRGRRDDSEYRELPRRDRNKREEQLYQGLRDTRDTYDSLQHKA